ncbi:MAG: hypothetical protein WDM77_18655 [Steroidobacteraceae bacterium]
MVSLGNGVAVTMTTGSFSGPLLPGEDCAETPDAAPSKSVAQGAHWQIARILLFTGNPYLTFSGSAGSVPNTSREIFPTVASPHWIFHPR